MSGPRKKHVRGTQPARRAPATAATAARAEAVPPPSDPAARRADLGLQATIGLSLALFLLASLHPSNLVWGLSLLAAWPPPAALGLAALGLAGFLPPVQRVLGRGLATLGVAWERHRIAGDVIVVLMVVVPVLFLSDPIRFVGDYDLRVGALRADLPPARLFAQAFPADRFLNVAVPRALMELGIEPARALHVVGAGLAVFFALAAIGVLRGIGARGAAVPGALVVILGSACLQHFAGYDKFGPLMVGIAGCAAGAVRLTTGRGGWWLLAAGAVLSLASHRIGAMLLPATLLVLFQAWRSARDRTLRLQCGLAALAVIGAAALLLPRAIELLLTVDRGTHLTAPAATIPERIRNSVNVLLFLTPLWPAGALAAGWITRVARAPSSAHASFSLAPAVWLALAPQVLATVFIAGSQGAARDWDIHVPAGAVVSLATAAALALAWSRMRDPRSIVPAVTVMIALGVASWGVGVNEGISLRRIESLIEGRPPWSVSQRAIAYDFLGLREINLARYDRAAEYLDRAVALAPNPRFWFESALAHARAGRFAEARSRGLEAARRDPAKAESWILLSQVSTALGDSAGAKAFADSARQAGGAQR